MKKIYIQYGLILFSAIFSVCLWEYLIEPRITTEYESFEEATEYVATVTLFVFLSLVYPFIYAVKKEKESLHSKEKIARSLEKSEGERDRLEKQVLQSQRLESIGTLAGGIAHDFNNILTVILGYSDPASFEKKDREKLMEGLQEINDAGQKAANLTGQLLAFSRRQVLEMGVVDMNRVYNTMSGMLERLIGEHCRLEFHSRTTRNVWADEGKMEQVVLNLVVNARDAMPEGGPISISLAEERYFTPVDENRETGAVTETFVELTVQDQGCGIAEDVQEKIFDPFFSTKTNDKGTGLGLATVYGIVRQHKGHIIVDSEPDKGTTFTVFLPAATEEQMARAQENTAREITGGSESILVVEDDPSVLRLITGILEPLGYTIMEAQSGEKALEIAETADSRADILLTDVIMPGMNGRQLSEKIHSIWPETRVILMTGYSEDIISRHGVLDSGFILIEKPIVAGRLARTIRDTLDSLPRA